MNKKLVWMGLLAMVSCSGCMATVHPDGSVQATYLTPVIEEPAIFVGTPAPLVVFRGRPRPHPRPVVRPPVVTPVVRPIAPRPGGPKPPVVRPNPQPGHGSGHHGGLGNGGNPGNGSGHGAGGSHNGGGHSYGGGHGPGGGHGGGHGNSHR